MPGDLPLPSTFKAKPFLTIEPDFVDSQAAERVVRGARASSSLSGAANTEVDPAPLIMRRTYTYHCTSRAEISELRDFYRARKGRSEPFWFIDWQTDFVIDPYTDVGSYVWTKPRTTSDGSVAYGTSLFPLGDFYRYLGLARALEFALYKVTAVAEDTPVGSGLERLALTQFASSGGFSAGPPYTVANGFRAFWIRYGRFDTDTLALEFHASDEAIAVLPIIDLPVETPA